MFHSLFPPPSPSRLPPGGFGLFTSPWATELFTFSCRPHFTLVLWRRDSPSNPHTMQAQVRTPAVASAFCCPRRPFVGICGVLIRSRAVLGVVDLRATRLASY